MELSLCAWGVIGLVATAAGDLWQWLASIIHQQKLNDWRPVGRWVAGFRLGRFCYSDFAEMQPVAHENAIGWLTHYGVGLAYALLYLGGLALLQQPSGWSMAILFGLVTTVAPFLWMKPAMGLGYFGCKTEKPGFTRYVTISTHLAFGLGLHLGVMLFQSFQ